MTAVTTRPDPASIWFGLLWLGAWTFAMFRAERILELLERRPALVWSIPALAFLGMLPAILDGGYPGNIATQAVWLVAVAAALANWRVVLATGFAAFVGKALVFYLTGTGPEPFGEGFPVEARTALLLPLALVPLTIALMASVRPLAGLIQDPKSEPVSDLTPAQQEIVSLLGEGLTPKEIAVRRKTSVETVRTQIKQARRKIGARTTDELVARSWRSK